MMAIGRPRYLKSSGLRVRVPLRVQGGRPVTAARSPACRLLDTARVVGIPSLELKVRMLDNPLITAESIQRVLPQVTNRSQLLKMLGVTSSTSNYARLEQIADANNISLPLKNNNGKPGPRPSARTSPVWNKERLEEAVVDSDSMLDVLAKLGLPNSNRTSLLAAAAAYGIELPRGRGGNHTERRRLSIERSFTKGARRASGGHLRKLIIAMDFMPYICAECGQLPEWNGKLLVLPLDHINGDPTDSTLENLRFLCPNCHSQTETFAGRNIGKNAKN
jgi:hypothetical protein